MMATICAQATEQPEARARLTPGVRSLSVSRMKIAAPKGPLTPCRTL
jgi:hypothetical protein